MFCSLGYIILSYFCSKLETMQKIHLISATEPLIADLAIAIREKDYVVSVSGQGLTDAGQAKLQSGGCVCYGEGWYPEKLSRDTSVVVLGATVKQDNPELIQAKKLGLLIQSIPEFIFQRCKSKTRVVVGGSHGKKKILSLIIHALKQQKLEFDYAFSSVISPLPNHVSMRYEPRIALIEADEHITLALDKKFQLEFYRPQIAVLTSLHLAESPDHLSPEEFMGTYATFAGSIEREGKLIYYEADEQLEKLAANVREDITSIPYNRHEVVERDGNTFLKTRYGEFLINLNGDDFFLVNLNAARLVCRQLGIKDADFYRAVSEYSLSLPA